MQKAALSLCLILLLAASASAQTSSPLKCYVGGGFSLGDKPGLFDAEYDPSLHGMIGAGYTIASNLEAVVRGTYDRFDNSLFGDNDGDISILTVGLFLRPYFQPPQFPMGFYALAGLGVAQVNMETIELRTVVDRQTEAIAYSLAIEDQSKLFYSFGAGVQYQLLPKVGVFGEIIMNEILTEQAETVFDNGMRTFDFTFGLRLL